MSNFNEDLAGAFYDVFNRLTRRTLDQKEVDMLQSTSTKLAKVITAQAERTALERCKKLNDATSEGFDKVFEEVKELRDILTATHESIKALIEGFKGSVVELEEGGGDEEV